MSGISLTEEEAAEVILRIMNVGGYISLANLERHFMAEIGVKVLFNTAVEILIAEGKLAYRADAAKLFLPVS